MTGRLHQTADVHPYYITKAVYSSHKMSLPFLDSAAATNKICMQKWTFWILSGSAKCDGKYPETQPPRRL
jgi:hypothetical protein